MSYRTQILNMSMAVMLLSICISCKRAGRPARVMLPDTITYSAGVLGEKMLVPTVADNFPFYTSDTTVTINGVQRSLLAIAVPDQQFDETAMNLVKAYEPLAGFLWAELQRDHKTGVLVNFCGDSKNSIQKRQDITMQNFKGEDLPASVVFVWDSSSAFRANYFIQQLSQMSEIKIGRETTVSDDFLQLKPTINN
jgi:hypothetical protein